MLRVFENRVLRGIFEHKRDEIIGEWRKLHNEKHNDLYCSSTTVRVIKSDRMRWAEHVAGMGRAEVHAEFWWGTPKEGGQLEDSDVGERVILRRIFKKWDGEAWTRLIWLRIGTGDGLL